MALIIKKLEKTHIVECNKIQNKYYPNLFSRFAEVNDPRNQSYIDYLVKVMLGTLYYKCIGGVRACMQLEWTDTKEPLPDGADSRFHKAAIWVLLSWENV